MLAATDSLTSLDLSSNLNLHDNFLKTEGAKALVDGGAFRGSLTSLNLASNALLVMGAKALVDGGAFNSSLSNIDVGHNSLTLAASLKLLAAMKGKSMVSIGMASCGLGVEGAKVVAEYTRRSTSPPRAR